jgi:galactokinase/mevalonate kinase-like predicted kinase
MNDPYDLLLSVPPHMLRQLAACEASVAARAFTTCDPPGAQLGSGGGTAYVLAQAWKASGVPSFKQWLETRPKILMHGGGESRRLPAYAGVGKLFLPLPALRWARGQRLNQTLLDMQEPFLSDILMQAPACTRLMIASGDVILRGRRGLTPLPEADVVLLGMWMEPEAARHFGVMFCSRNDPQRLRTFLQKPAPDAIRERSRHDLFLADVGVWLLSERAIHVLMTKCGWDEGTGNFAGRPEPAAYDLYGGWALHLGNEPTVFAEAVSNLSVAVVPVEKGEFYHFGTSRDMIDSMVAMQNIVRDQTLLGAVPSLAQPRQFIQNALFDIPVRRDENHSLWVENSCVPKSWNLSARHVITGVPENQWALTLQTGQCLDMVPLGEDRLAVRIYGFGDRFSGAIDDEQTEWLERSARTWFHERNLTLHDAGIEPGTDLQRAALFPVLEAQNLDGDFIQWLLEADHDPGSAHREFWLSSQRLSARALAQETNLRRLYAQKDRFRKQVLPVMAAHGGHSLFYKLDLLALAQDYAASGQALVEPGQIEDTPTEPLLRIHQSMFQAQVKKLREDERWRLDETAAFTALADIIVRAICQEPVVPQCRVMDDQIVWGRSPARIDLAGGWSDTPPYCLEHGGSVTNIAVNLNGLPPIQVFARKCERRSLTIRSIDLGLSEVLTTYEDVGAYRSLGSGFAVARAALALAGFHPTFNGARYDSLKDQLEALGGGIELSMLAAIPKGSGLGTSSILAGTLLGTLSELCDLNWDKPALCARVSVLEQILGSGGGWQDQFGGLLHGAKLIETHTGIDQTPSIRWLPASFFEAGGIGSRLLLYYTGITRVAHDVLSEIVRGMFLNDSQRLRILHRIRQNGRLCFDAVQRADVNDFCLAIVNSWEMNCALDSGVNPPEVEQIIASVAPHLSAVKLAGAGGGGFVFFVARDPAAAQEIQRLLNENPPNDRARFVRMTLSATGLEVTRS